ncbi:hypothetical protein KM043_016903 [Ampulex compressa]|nr:hypothetical protein KM043_016903 [Ampulex compressa]
MMEIRGEQRIWHAAAKEKIKSLNNYQVWELIELPPEDHRVLEPKPVATKMKAAFLTVSRENFKELDNNGLYRTVMGSVLYITTVSRPDIAAAVGVLCRRVEKPTNHNCNAAKRVM